MNHHAEMTTSAPVFSRAVLALALSLAFPVLASAQTTKGLLDRGVAIPMPAGAPSVATPSPQAANYPAWYRDRKGMVLDPCFSNVPSPAEPLFTLCPASIVNTTAFPGNWGSEFLYSLANADLTIGSVAVQLITSLQGAYTTNQPTIGDEVVFSRLRIRGRQLPDGMYRVTHPYGVEILYANAASGKAGIDWTRDVGFAPGMFDLALAGDIGPYVQWADLTGEPTTITGTNPATGAVEEYLGDPNVLHTIANSPNGTNYFRLEQSYDGGVSWVILGQTDFFIVAGKKHVGAVPLPIEIGPATFSRAQGSSLAAGIDVRVKAVPSQPNTSVAAQDQMVVSGLGLPMTTMTYLGGLDWFAHIDFAGVVPFEIVVTNTADNNAQYRRALVDTVLVTDAIYAYDTGMLTVKAKSSDRKASSMTYDGISMRGVSPGEFILDVARPLPPASVRVTSLPGSGSATSVVDIRPLGDATGAPLVAVDDQIAMFEDTPASLDLAANDTGITSATVLTISRAPVNGTLTMTGTTVKYMPRLNYNNTLATVDTFTYTLSIGTMVSAPATVSVLVAPVNDAPTVANDAYSFTSGASLTLSVLTNDVDVDGAIDVATVRIATAPAAGLTLTVQANGSILASATTAGVYSFTYTVADGFGARSTAATVQVTVLSAPVAETLKTTLVQYTRASRKWDIRGTTTKGGSTITAYHCATYTTSCAVIGSVVSSANGAFSLAVTSPVGFTAAKAISVKSSGGSTLNNRTVTVK